MHKSGITRLGEKYAVRKHENQRRNRSGIGINDIDRASNADAGKLKVYRIFAVFSIFIIIDYFITLYAIGQHLYEFNPITVSIFKSWPFPEIVFLGFKLLVISLNFLIIYSALKLSRKSRIMGIAALYYMYLALIFSVGVVVYDIGILFGIKIPIVNDVASWFFEVLGLI